MNKKQIRYERDLYYLISQSNNNINQIEIDLKKQDDNISFLKQYILEKEKEKEIEERNINYNSLLKYKNRLVKDNKKLLDRYSKIFGKDYEVKKTFNPFELGENEND